jgi:bacillithiol biosynthesis cysteine-adding enzyme BshC
MTCVSIPYRRLPHQAKLFLRFIEEFQSVQSFYAHPPKIEAVQQVARELQFPPERRAEVATVLRAQNQAFGAESRTEENLKLLEQGAVAIVSGQQVGLFGGPAYAFYKALTAIQIAAELSEASIPAVPIFWMATEDHDVDEVRHVSWFHSGELLRFELPPDETRSHIVGATKLRSEIHDVAKRAAGLLTGPGFDLVAQSLRDSYSADETYGSAFAKLFARIFAEQGLILLDPLDARLHRIASPIYRKAIEESESLTEALLRRGKELQHAGFDSQVKVTSRSTLLFRLQNGSRNAITANGGKFKVGAASFSRDELLGAVDSAPETFSPNALLRPVVQDYLLPTAAYLGGPAEISYFAQSEVLYKRLLGRMPALLPRADFTLVDAKGESLLQRYGLCIENLWAGPQELQKKMEALSVPRGLAAKFDRNKAQTEKTLAKLADDITKLDPTLHGAVETARKKMEFQLEKLRRKTGRALDEKTGLVRGHEDFLENLLYPNKELQSRQLCFLPFLARWGAEGLHELQRNCSSANLTEHRILRIP